MAAPQGQAATATQDCSAIRLLLRRSRASWRLVRCARREPGPSAGRGHFTAARTVRQECDQTIIERW